MESSRANPVDNPSLAAARRGDGRAARILYDTLAPVVLGYARGQGVEDPDALANEAMYRALRDVASFTGDTKAFRSWVFTIAHNLVIDDRRRQARRPVTIELERARSRPDGTYVAEAVMDRLEVAETITWIQDLTPDQKSVLLLRFLLDLPLAEVAIIVDKPVGAVKALQHRGLAALRRRIAAEGVSPMEPPTFTVVP